MAYDETTFEKIHNAIQNSVFIKAELLYFSKGYTATIASTTKKQQTDFRITVISYTVNYLVSIPQS